MAKNVAIGIQSFSKLIENDCFYVDKTDFIREWWDSKDEVTLKKAAFLKGFLFGRQKHTGICREPTR